ncbi:hypothetical protein [Streptomyces sp. NPDC048411]|uniref:hypothetical protein n=1 Tax=Streptomyces sp. NPDC048411 TaxID=3157206 RepID=UPI0034524E7F
MPGITGTWSAEMNTPFGKQNLTITLKGGEPPMGILDSPEGRSEVQGLVLTEDTANFTLPIDTPIKATVVWKLRAEGDDLSGTVKAGFFPASKLKGSRASEEGTA